MADVVEVRDIHSLTHYQMLWNSLFAETPRSTFFHTFDWLQIYWRHFGHEQQLRVLVIKAGGQTLGILPLCVRDDRHRVMPVRTLTYPLDDWGDFYGPIGKNSTASLLLAMRHLATSQRDWDEIDLRWIDQDAADRGRTQRAMKMASLAPREESYAQSSVIRMRGTWDDYLASRDKKVRHELQRRLRRVKELGHVEFIRHRPAASRTGDGDPGWDLYDQCEQVSATSWQAKVERGNTLCHRDYRAYYRDAHQAAARLGMVDMTLLKIDGKPVAYGYNYHHQGRVLGLRMGYDQKFDRHGLGTAMMALSVRDGFERGDEELNMGVGNQKFKQRLRTHCEASTRLVHTPISAWRPQLLQASRWIASRCGSFGRRPHALPSGAKSKQATPN